ncbi:hypothetical protein BD310DRAFT_684665 [Dichomitus squalens]|uniref:Secreted protein n=1 Tax=Dichomitus squalens TaxID=114155 RepID=A0A4Q9PMH9_9APHY|nr:hypothetical protein BD310DRAFT_684665 [Dichomitus squalens]
MLSLLSSCVACLRSWLVGCDVHDTPSHRQRRDSRVDRSDTPNMHTPVYNHEDCMHELRFYSSCLKWDADKPPRNNAKVCVFIVREPGCKSSHSRGVLVCCSIARIHGSMGLS